MEYLPISADQGITDDSIGSSPLSQPILTTHKVPEQTLRKSVWERTPYPEVAYGEDQLWADEIIKLGYQKVYVPTACVYHSHDYMPGELAERAETEAFFFALLFGYDSFDLGRSFDDQLTAMQNADTQWARANGVSENDLARRLVEDRVQLYGRAKGMARARAALQRQAP